ncbi:hypothetical protein KA001_02150 [Patescibacteria group bacterium]|nr:hypothetical protein [Patescibacteria group bacterium]
MIVKTAMNKKEFTHSPTIGEKVMLFLIIQTLFLMLGISFLVRFMPLFNISLGFILLNLLLALFVCGYFIKLSQGKSITIEDDYLSINYGNKLKIDIMSITDIRFVNRFWYFRKNNSLGGRRNSFSNMRKIIFFTNQGLIEFNLLFWKYDEIKSLINYLIEINRNIKFEEDVDQPVVFKL